MTNEQLTSEQLDYIEHRLANEPTREELLTFARTLLAELRSVREVVTCSHCGRQRPRLIGVCDVCSIR